MAACAPGVTSAQGGDAASGFELSLHGPRSVLRGRDATFRGTAYRVRGLATLARLPGAIVRARWATDADGVSPGEWVEGRAARDGSFEVAVPMPARPEGNLRLEVSVGDGASERVQRFPLVHEVPWVLVLRSDRRRYEPGETLRAWARLTDRRTRAPLSGRTIAFLVAGQRRELATGASGVAAFEVVLPEGPDADGDHVLVAHLDGQSVSHAYEVGARTWERMLAEVEVTPEPAGPHAPLQVRVRATTASGAPVRSADVRVEIADAEPAHGVTDRDGVALVEARAPAYLTHATGVVSLVAHVRHRAHGSIRVGHALRLAVPLTLEVEVVPEHAGLVPEVEGSLYVRLVDGAGEPPEAGTPVRVTGPAVRGGEQRGETDAHGIVTLAAALPRGAAASDGMGEVRTGLVVHVEGPRPRTAGVVVPVLRDAEVVPRVVRPVVAPGETLEVTVQRRPHVGRRVVVVDLLTDTGVVATRRLAAGRTRASFPVGPAELGVVRVRARALHEDGVEEGAGAVAAAIVRPATATFPRLEPQRELYSVRDTAQVTLLTRAGGPTRWAAVLVRDLAAHAGERPFALRFLDHAFEQALLDPDAPASDALLRAALAAHCAADPVPPVTRPLVGAFGAEVQEYETPGTYDDLRGVLRDPFPDADELRLRGAAEAMLAVEAALDDALAADALDDLTVGRGAARRFRPDLLDEVGALETLGAEPATLAMLEAADPSFRFDTVARRVARRRLVRLLIALAHYLDPGDEASVQQRMAAREPADRWLPRMVQRGLIEAEALDDPWGGRFALRRASRPALVVAVEAASYELVSPGPDGRVGTRDDVVDPFARVVDEGTPYAIASGEDDLMRTLAQLSTSAQVLEALQAAYQRVAAEVSEEQMGDAVAASASAGFYGDQIGSAFGYGGLGLRGSGRGGGGVGYGTIGMGSVGTIGHGSGYGSAASGLAHLVRERFPATLSFSPAVEVEASGRTVLSIPLEDAITTYLVEVVVWGEDGFTWSADARFRVDQPTVVDGPVPRHATVGDELRLPVRVGNRTEADRPIALRASATASLGSPHAEAPAVSVRARDASEISLPLRMTTAGRGHVTIEARAPDGTPLDAVRRPIEVRDAMREVRVERESLLAGTAALELAVPRTARALEPAAVAVAVGDGIFATAAEPLWAAWTDAQLGRRSVLAGAVAVALRSSDASVAAAVGAAWSSDAVEDEAVARALDALTRIAGANARRPHGAHGPAELLELSRLLIGLAPAARVPSARPALRPALVAVLRTLRRTIESSSAEVADRPDVWAAAAAALVLSRPASGPGARARELARRARRSVLSVGDDQWLAAPRGDPVDATAWLAAAEVGLGEPAGLELVTSLGRRAARGRGPRGLSGALARVAAATLEPGPAPTEVTLVIDGEASPLPLRGGLGRLVSPALSRPGNHRVEVRAPGRAPVWVSAHASYGVPWSEPPAEPGPLVLEVEGGPDARDRVAGLALVVRNRSPRTLGALVVDVSLPAGAELDEDARDAIARHVSGRPEVGDATLRLRLLPLSPGGYRRVPLPFRFTVAGELSGLGVAGYAADRPEAVSVLPPRVLSVSEVSR